MARHLDTLVRLNEWEVDQKRRTLGEHLRRLEELQRALADLASELKREQEAAAGAPGEAGLLYGGYAQGVIQRRADLETRIRHKEADMVAARDDLSQAYIELKKFEIAKRQRAERAAQAEAKAEQEFLDEVGLQTHQRRRRKR